MSDQVMPEVKPLTQPIAIFAPGKQDMLKFVKLPTIQTFYLTDVPFDDIQP